VAQDIEALGTTGVLRGTRLLPPEASGAVVLIVPGSGPTDRNGNRPGGLIPSTYQLLAERLFDQGIATVRIDKRGIYGSASALFDTDNTTIEDYAVDIRLWVTTIQRVDSRIARIRENAMI
jgi:hypothetical protein